VHFGRGPSTRSQPQERGIQAATAATAVAAVAAAAAYFPPFERCS